MSLDAVSSPSSSWVRISEKEFRAGGAVLAEKLSQVAQKGFCYLEIPEKCRPFIEDAVSFTDSFYSDNQLKGLKLEGFSGYKDRESLQLESYYFERNKYWTLLPDRVQTLATEMHLLGVTVLKNILAACQIPETEQVQLTGNASKGQGMVHFTCNHYRSEKDYPGGYEHRDFGLITVLFINKKGLQAKLGEEWVDVPPEKDHFVINFGKALEASVTQVYPLTAAWHRVQKVTESRISFGIFIDGHQDSKMFIKTKDGEIEATGMTAFDYIKKSFAETPQ